jgi:hypothetical protein
VAALPKKLRVSLKRALEEADSKDRDVEISCGAALGTTNDDDNTPTIELDLQDAESLSSRTLHSRTDHLPVIANSGEVVCVVCVVCRVCRVCVV